MERYKTLLLNCATHCPARKGRNAFTGIDGDHGHLLAAARNGANKSGAAPYP